MIRSFKDGVKEELAAGRSPKRECGEREARSTCLSYLERRESRT